MTKCDTCLKRLLGAPNKSADAVLINVKLRGALQWPSDVLFNGLRDVENTLSSYTSDQFTPFMFSNYLEDSLPAMLPVKAVLCESHSSMLAADSLVYYVCTRLHWHAKSVTRNTASKS